MSVAAHGCSVGIPQRAPHTHALSHTNVQNGKIETRSTDEKLGAIGEMGKGQLGLVFASSTRLLPGEDGGKS
jgi:hypothetical protein